MKITDQNINYYLNIIKSNWLEAPEDFPDFLVEIPPKAKEENEQYLQKKLEELRVQINSYTKLPIGRKRWISKTIALMKDILYHEKVIGIHNIVNPSSSDAFFNELMDFLRKARDFAPDLPFEDIGQAIRNYIVYRMFKEMHHVEVGFSQAGFGYSMLYPFTDNYIDNDRITENEKQSYNQLIKDQLQGKTVKPASIHHRKTCELLQAIETEYGGDRDSSVFTLLLMMLDAQAKSLDQQNNQIQLTPEERLNISIYKGGISVLIDRFLVKKEVTEEDMVFYLGMGLFLQLADDLQDIGTDSQQGWQTIFTVNLHPDQEEVIVNKLLHFIHNIMASYRSENEVFKNFLLSNCYQLIYTSLVGSSKYFSWDYRNQIEKYLPVTGTFLSQFKRDLLWKHDTSQQKNYRNILDAILSFQH